MPVITLPTPEEMAALELFEGLPLERIFVPLTVQEFGIAADKLCSHSVLGFDTETKPSFVRGLESRGPHIVQLATPHYAVIFQVFRDGCLPAVRRIL